MHCSAGSPKNIQRVQNDLDKFTQTIHIIPFLTAFVADIVIEQKGSDACANPDPAFLKDIVKESKKIVKEMLCDALSFCNNSRNTSRNELLSHLEN